MNARRFSKLLRTPKVSEGGKLLETRLIQKKTDIETRVEPACVKLDSLNVLMAEIKAPAIKLEEQIKLRALQARVSESKNLLLYDETQSLKQRLDTGVPFHEEIE